MPQFLRLFSGRAAAPRLFGVATLAWAAVWATPAPAAFVAITAGRPGGLGAESPANIGWAFTANADLTVTALGVYDDDADGLVQSHPMAIWDAATGALVVSARVPGGTAGVLRDGFRYQAVAPAYLFAGHAYVIAAHYVQDATNGAEDTVVQYGYTPITADSHIALDTGNGRFEFADDFRMPPADFIPEFGPNFQFDLTATASAVPAPPAAALLGMCVLTLCGYGWRRRRAAS